MSRELREAHAYTFDKLTVGCGVTQAYTYHKQVCVPANPVSVFSVQVRLKQKLRINQLQLQRLKLIASADALTQLSPSAEYTLQTELAEADSRLAAKQTELEDVSVQLQDQRENMTELQQVRPLKQQCYCIVRPVECGHYHKSH